MRNGIDEAAVEDGERRGCCTMEVRCNRGGGGYYERMVGERLVSREIGSYRRLDLEEEDSAAYRPIP